MRFSIDVTKSCSALYSNCTGLVIYEDGPHSAKVDYQTVAAERTTAYVVSAATNRRDQTIRTSEMDRCNNVRDARALGDYLWMFADTCIPDFTGFVVARVRRLEDLAMQYGPEWFDIHKAQSRTGFYSSSRVVSLSAIQPGNLRWSLDARWTNEAFPLR
jgi:hypothetical protein